MTNEACCSFENHYGKILVVWIILMFLFQVGLVACIENLCACQMNVIIYFHVKSDSMIICVLFSRIS